MKHSFIDKYSFIDSLLNRIDQRIKIVGFVTFILFINFTKPTSFLSFFLYGLILLVLVLLSEIPISFIFKRVLVIIPFVLMISLFIPFLKNDGVMIFYSILIKAILSILCMILLTVTTNFSKLLKAFQDLKCPELMLMIISFMYRYFFLINGQFLEMQQAKNSRTTTISNWRNTKTNASLLGMLFLRSYERAENVYLAMQARGFNGDIKTLNNLFLQKRDWTFLFVLIILLTGARFIV